MFPNQKVVTPYGVGLVTCVRDESTVIVVPCNWLMAAGQKPTYYLNPKDVKAFYGVDSEVLCSFGRGTIKSIRPEDGIYVVLLDNWQLANGQSPTLYLNESSLSKPLKTLPKDDVIEPNFTAKRLAMALDAKNAAADFFKKSEWYNARALYVESLNILQEVGDSMTNDEKAKIFEVSVLCNNNAALCSLKVENYGDSLQATKNSSLLIRALESRIPDGEVWKCLLGTGMTEERLQKEWKKKTLFLMGKAHLGLGNLQEAVDTLKSSLALIAGDAALVKQADELRKLIADAQARRSKELRKEKAVWSKAFEKGKAPENALYSDAPEDKSPSAVPSPMNSPKRAVLPPGSKPQLDLDLAQYGLGPSTAGKAEEKKKTTASAAASAGTVWKPITGSNTWIALLAVLGVGVGVGLKVLWPRLWGRR